MGMVEALACLALQPPKAPQIRAETRGRAGTITSQALPEASIQRTIRLDAQVILMKKNKPEDVIYGAKRRSE
jgi:cytochrome P450